MRQVIFHSLTLAGFGVYGKRTTFRFPAGLGARISDNETGKSTMLAGLLAVLFGLPEKNDPEAWGTTRFQSWHDPLPFEGELLLRANGHWHRIRRDFTTHKVDWMTAAGREAAPAPPDPSSKDWHPYFQDEHNPVGRGEPVQRYRRQLRELIGIDDLDLFRLTFCLAQDIDERTEKEEAFRTREVPGDVRQLLSGSGGRVDEVRSLLFDAFAEVTMATGDAGLVRPGRKKPANQRTNGRLEEVTERIQQVRGRLGAASTALEALQGSREELEELRQKHDEQKKHLTESRNLLGAWDHWSDARAERRERHKRAVAMEAAIRQLAGEAAQHRQLEEELRTTYPEYSAEAFPITERQTDLGRLISFEEEREELGRRREQLRNYRESLGEQITELEGEIKTRFAPFLEHPHLLKEFEAWRQVAKEIEELREGFSDLEREIADSEGALGRISRWSSLDAEAATHGTAPRAVAILRAFSTRVPALLARAAEAARLGDELVRIREQMEGPLSAVAAVPEDVRREATTYAERQRLLRVKVEETARRAQETATDHAEIEQRAASLAEARQALAETLGAPETDAEDGSDEQPTPTAGDRLPAGWEALRSVIGTKLDLLREEGDLLRKAADIPQMIRPVGARRVLLPALISFVVAAAAGLAGGYFLVAETPWRLLIGIAMGLAGAITAGAVALRRSGTPVLENLPVALQRLQGVRLETEVADRQLGRLRDLDSRALDELHHRLEEYATGLADLRESRATELAGADAEEIRSEADAAAAELAAFEERMAAFGEAPHKLVAEWNTLNRRAEEISARLADLEAEIGPADWQSLPVKKLPPVWAELQRLAAIVTTDEAPRSGGEVASVLGRATPADWEDWMREATRFEQAQSRLISLRTRQAALQEDKDAGSRLERLEARATELAAICAPFTLDSSDEEVAWAAQEFEKKRGALDRVRTLREKTTADISVLEKEREARQSEAQTLRKELDDLLKPTSGDPQRARDRLRAAGDLRGRLQHGTETESQVLKSHGVESAEELRLKLEELRQEGDVRLREIRDLESRFLLFRELAEADPEEIQQRHTDLTARIAAEEETLAESDQQRDRLQESTADALAEGRRVGNVAVLELELQTLEREREELQREREALRIAFATIGEAEQLFAETYRERLAERATVLFRQITHRDERTIQLGEDFGIVLLEPDGRRCVPRQLSQGARDQLALALRLAVAELLSAERQIPLLLDDPFLTFDPDRLDAMRKTLEQVGGDRQVVLLSHREELSAWGTALGVESHTARTRAPRAGS